MAKKIRLCIINVVLILFTYSKYIECGIKRNFIKFTIKIRIQYVLYFKELFTFFCLQWLHCRHSKFLDNRDSILFPMYRVAYCNPSNEPNKIEHHFPLYD